MIPVKLEKEEGKYMLIHGYTGAIDIVDSELKEYLMKTKIIQKDSFIYSDLIFSKLIERGYLTTKSKEEENIYVKKVATTLQKRNKLLKKTFTLVVTYNCNFKCPYCFEKEIMKQNNKNNDFVISKKMVNNFFDAINKIESNTKLQNKSITLFGGEPLLRENKEIIEYIIDKGSQKGFTFTATSNGYDLDAYTNLLKKGGIEGVQITIDGTKNIHNLRRIHQTDEDSFSKIMNNIKLALDKGIAIKIRVNVDSQNINELKALCLLFRNNGFYSYKKFSTYAEYISGEINFNPKTYEEQNINKITHKDFFDIINSENINIEYNQQLYLKLYDSIKKNQPLTLSSTYCSAHDSSYIFDPFGYIYSCLEVVGNKEESIGEYGNAVIWNTKKNKWFDRNISNITSCSSCKYSLLCGGGCFAKALINNKDSYCNNFPFVLNKIANKIYSQLDCENKYV